MLKYLIPESVNNARIFTVHAISEYSPPIGHKHFGELVGRIANKFWGCWKKGGEQTLRYYCNALLSQST